MFALGVLTGIGICVFIAVILVAFRRPVEQAIEIVGRSIDTVSPVKPKGFLWEPESDADEARAEKIRENAERGADTPISELL